MKPIDSLVVGYLLGIIQLQLYGDYFISHSKDPGSLLNKVVYIMESIRVFFSWLNLYILRVDPERVFA